MLAGDGEFVCQDFIPTAWMTVSGYILWRPQFGQCNEKSLPTLSGFGNVISALLWLHVTATSETGFAVAMFSV
jgi:hypothetical protein